MNKKSIKKILLYAASILGFLILVLAVHIYIVTRPKAPDAHTRIMARIDIKQPITQDEAGKITAWLYQQKGVDRVLVNPTTDIAIFTFFPIQTNANLILSHFKSSFHLQADRYLPSAEAMQGGCPVASTSATYKVYSFIKHIF
jgi:hypothetical protein